MSVTWSSMAFEQVPTAEYALHWLPEARRCRCENCDARPLDAVVDLLVIHCISLPPGEFGGPWIEDLFGNRLDADVDPRFAPIAPLKVSAHLLIRRDGELLQFVPLSARAWHAGQSVHEGRPACNDYSIGIELEGSDDTPFEDVQYRCLTAVTKTIMQGFPKITPQRIVGHSDIAPGRKSDPGPCFNWSRYRAELQIIDSHA
jgi:AmpD protein